MSPETERVRPPVAIRLPGRRRRRRWWMVVVLVAVAAAVWVGVTVLGEQQAARRTREELTTYTVTRSDLHVTITETGALKAKRSERLWPDISGRGKVAWLIEEGVEVDSGDELVVLEQEEVKKNVTDTTVQLKQATAARIQAEEQLAILTRQSESDLKAARVKLEIAELELQRYKEGERPKLLRQAQLKLDKAKVDKAIAEEDLAGMEEYVAKDYFTKKDLEQRKIALREANDALETAQLELQLLDRFQIPKDLAQRQSDVDQAKTALELTERKAKSEQAQKEADLEQRQFVEKTHRERLEQLERERRGMTIRAPSRGLVIYGDDRQWWSRRDIRVGMDVWRGQAIVTVPDLTAIEILISISEVDLDKIQIGQPAAITLDAYPTLAFRGKATRVSTLAERRSRWAGSDVSTFELTIDMDMDDAQHVLADLNPGPSSKSRLRPGMSAKAEVDVATLPNVLCVPLDAVFEDRGVHACYVMEDGKPVWRQIEIGMSNRTHVEVTKGLAEGERVCRYDPQRLAGKREPATQPTTRRARTRPASRPGSQPTSRSATVPAHRPERGPEDSVRRS